MQSKPIDSSSRSSQFDEIHDAPLNLPLPSPVSPREHVLDVGVAAEIAHDLPDDFFGEKLAKLGLDVNDAAQKRGAARDRLALLSPEKAQRAVSELDQMGKLEKFSASLNPEERERFLSLLADKGVLDRVPAKNPPHAYGVRAPDLYVPNEKTPATLKKVAQEANFEAAAAYRGNHAVWSERVQAVETDGPVAVQQPGARQELGRTSEEQSRLRGGQLPSAGQAIRNPTLVIERGVEAGVAATDVRDRIAGLSDGDLIKYKALGASFEVKRDGFDDYKVSLRYVSEQSMGGEIGIHAGVLEAELGAKTTITTAAEVEFKASSPDEANQVCQTLRQLVSLEAAERRAGAEYLKAHLHVAKLEMTRGESAEASVGAFGAKVGVEAETKRGVAKGVSQEGKFEAAISEDEAKWAAKVFGMKVAGEDFKRESHIEKHTDREGHVSYEVKLKLTATRADGVGHESKTVFHLDLKDLSKLEAALAKKNTVALQALAHDGHGTVTTRTYKTFSLGVFENERVFDRQRKKL